MTLKLRKKILIMSKYAIYGIFIQALMYSFVFAESGRAQNMSIEKINITVELNDLSIKESLAELEKLTGFEFAYKHKILNSKKKLTYEKKSVSLANLLRDISKETNLGFKRVNEIIYVNYLNRSSGFVIEENLEMVDVTIKGKVTDENGEGLPGAAVVVKQTKVGTTTDLDGNYTLAVPEGSMLVISFVGYKTLEMDIGNQSTLDIQMEPDTEQLEEVVVVGYGTQKKSDLTGSVVQVNAEDFVIGANTNALQLLGGKASGVHISQSSNSPGGTVEIKVRGVSSVNGGNGVLVVIDGMPNGDVNALSMEDIESVQVLKDASASAIYGSRAANGVVLITTKQGNAKEMSVSYSSYMGFQNVIKRMDMLNGAEWMGMLNALDFESDPNNATDPNYTPRYTDSEIAAVGEGFDWQDQIFRNSVIHNHQLSISGGSEKAKYYASVNYMDNQGVVRNSGQKRYNTRLNLTATPIDKLSVNLNLNVNRIQNDEVSLGRSYDGVVAAALLFDPTLDAELNDLGRYKFNDFLQVDNPEGVLQGWDRNRATNQVFANTRISYEILKGLKVNVNLGTRLTNAKYDQYQNRFTPEGAGSNGEALAENRDNTYGIAEYLLSYDLDKGDHSFKIQGGITYERFENKLLSATARDFLSDANGADFFQAANVENYTAETNRFVNTLRSQLARVNYSYMDKYLLTASVRADGTSKFSDKNKTAIFPSASFGWQVAQEQFMKGQNFIGSLKLRLGYGAIGNQAINNFETITTFLPGSSEDYSNAVLGGSVQTGVVPTRIANENLKWETTKEVNVGVDFAIMDFKISGSIEYYVRNTSDQLFNRPVPRSSGFGSYRENFGNVRNKGIDITLNTRNLSGDLKWETDLTLSFLKNEVTEVPDFVGGRVLSGGGYGFIGDFAIVRKGDPLNAFYGYQMDGVYSTQAQVDAAADAFPDGSARQGLGHPIVRDVNGDGIISPDDRVIVGDPFADLMFGLNNRFSYKGFTLDIFFVGVQGIDAFNNLIAESFYPIDPDRNKLAKYYNNRWSPDNTSGIYPSMVEPGRYQDGRKVNKWTVQDASFIRLKNVTFSYDMPLQSKGFKTANVFLSLENMLTISSYDGFDPDANSSGSLDSSARTTRGTFGDYPLARTIRLGVKFGI